MAWTGSGAGTSNGQGMEFLIMPILPPGFSLSSLVGLSHLFEKVIWKAMHEGKSLLKEDLNWDHVLVKSPLLSASFPALHRPSAVLVIRDS